MSEHVNQQQVRRLVRPTHDKMIGGVCSGVARMAGIDPTLVRVLALVAGVFGFPVVPLIYVLMWAIIPASD